MPRAKAKACRKEAIDPRVVKLLQGAWVATQIGPLIVTGTTVKYVNCGPDCPKLTGTEDGYVRIGLWQAKVNADTIPPSKLKWTRVDDPQERDVIYWNRLPQGRAQEQHIPMEAAPSSLRSQASTPTRKNTKQKQTASVNREREGAQGEAPPPENRAEKRKKMSGIEMDRDPAFQEPSRSKAKAASHAGSSQMRPSHQPGPPAICSIKIGTTQVADVADTSVTEDPEPRQGVIPDTAGPNEDMQLVVDTASTTRAPSKANGMLKSSESKTLDTTCAACFSLLHLAAPQDVVGRVCDVCTAPADSAPFLICSGLDFDLRVLGIPGKCEQQRRSICEYEVCSKCSQLPHSKRPPRQTLKFDNSRKLPLIGTITIAPTRSIW